MQARRNQLESDAAIYCFQNNRSYGLYLIDALQILEVGPRLPPLRPRHTAQNFDFLKNISALKKIPLPKFDPVFWHMLVMSTRGRLIQISKTFSVYDHHNFKFQFKCVPFVLVYWDFWFLPRQPEFDSPHGSDTIILDYSISCRLR